MTDPIQPGLERCNLLMQIKSELRKFTLDELPEREFIIEQIDIAMENLECQYVLPNYNVTV